MSWITDAKEIIENGHIDALRAYASNVGTAYAVETFEEAYEGELTYIQLAEQLVDDGCLGELSDVALRYFDYDALAQDLRLDYTHIDGHMFRDL